MVSLLVIRMTNRTPRMNPFYLKLALSPLTFVRAISPHCEVTKKIFLVLSACVFAFTAKGTTVFDTFGPMDTYDPGNAYEVGTFFMTPIESAAQFTAGASGDLATVYLGLTYGRNANPVNVYLYGDASGSPDNANQIPLGSVAATAAYSTTNNSVVSFAVAGTVPVTMGSTYWLVLKPSGSNVDSDWNASFPPVSGMTDYSIDDSGIWASYSAVLPAFRLTTAPSAVPDSGSTILLMLGALAPLLVLQRKLIRRRVSQ